MAKESNIKAAKRKKDKVQDFVGDEDRLYQKRVKLGDKGSRMKDDEICAKVNGTNFKLGRLYDGHEKCLDERDSKKKRKNGKKGTAQHLQSALAEEENLLVLSHENNSSSVRLLEADENEEIVSICSEQQSPDKKAEKDDRSKKKKKRGNDCSGETLKGRVDDKEDGFLFDKQHENIKKKKNKSNEKIVQQDVEMSNPKSESKRVTKGKKRKRKNRELNNRDEPDQGNNVEGNFQSCSSDCADKKDSRKGKKKKKNERNGEQGSEKERKSLVHPAVDYLLTWYNDRNSWSFKKVRQVWLLHNIFDQKQISDENFCILLKYLEGMKGAAKAKTIDMAEKKLETATGTAENQAMVENRVRQVLQMLSE